MHTSVKRNGFLSASKKSEKRKEIQICFSLSLFRRRPLPKERGAEYTSMGDESPIPPASFFEDKKRGYKESFYFFGFCHISIL